jgi:hypothetical protein
MNRLRTAVGAAAIVAAWASIGQAQDHRYRNLDYPSPWSFYAGPYYRFLVFDGWDAIPAEEYESGWMAGVEGGIRYFDKPWMLSAGGEFAFLGEAEVNGTDPVLGAFENREEFMLYGGVIRIGVGSDNFTFGILGGAGVITVDEEVFTVPTGRLSADDSDIYYKWGVFLERALIGPDHGLQLWGALDVDYTLTEIEDAAGRSNLRYWSFTIRVFLKY